MVMAAALMMASALVMAAALVMMVVICVGIGDGVRVSPGMGVRRRWRAACGGRTGSGGGSIAAWRRQVVLWDGWEGGCVGVGGKR